MAIEQKEAELKVQQIAQEQKEVELKVKQQDLELKETKLKLKELESLTNAQPFRNRRKCISPYIYSVAVASA